MSECDKLTIETKNRVLDAVRDSKESIAESGDYVQLTVSDNGCGIPAGVVARIFEPFFSTKPQGKGTGLGLSVVYGFVQRSHGDIKVDSEAGIGTTVSLYLPRTWESS